MTGILEWYAKERPTTITSFILREVGWAPEDAQHIRTLCLQGIICWILVIIIGDVVDIDSFVTLHKARGDKQQRWP